MEVIALLRGVRPTGKNRIPKMSFLVEILEKFYKYRAVTGIRKTTNTGKEKRVRPINFD